MIQRYTSQKQLVVLLVLLGMLTAQSIAQTVNVKIKCNTSTCLDTLRSSHIVGLQGESQKGIAGFTNWSTTLKLTNIGGDYWETTIAATPGDTIYYSFVTKFDDATFTKVNWGWDGPIDNGVNTRTNRMLVVGSKDTTLPLQYYNGWSTKVAQYAKPFAVKADTVAVYFRVNMGGSSVFDPATKTAAVYGGAPMGSWGRIITLTREVNSVNSGSMWSGVAYIAKTALTAGVSQQYKFVIDPDATWENLADNRAFSFSNNVMNVGGDTTLHWNYFNNKAPSSVVATTVNVTFRCNTSTCLDTLQPNHIVGLNGESVNGISGLVWGSGVNTIKLKNVGGDYWETTIKAQPGDVIHYKYITKYDDTTMSKVNWGWEGDFNNGYDSWGSRASVIGAKDTILPLHYYNGGTTKVAQDAKPFAVKADTVAVYFRVNMGGSSIFDPATMTAAVYGGAPLGSWARIITLTREVNSINNGSMWSGTAYIAKTALTAGASQPYKFVMDPAQTWENMDNNRTFSFSNSVINVVGDTTLLWKYFNNKAPAGAKITGNLLFSLKLNALEKAGLFNRALGDRVGVTGAKAWAADPVNFDTSAILKMTYSSDLDEWDLLESFTYYPNDGIVYKYYIGWDPSRVDTLSANYIPGLALSNGWEEPGFTGGADRKYTFTDAVNQIIPGDFGADQQYFNSIHPYGAIATPCTLTFRINMTPAANATTNPANRLFIPGTDSVFISFDGCLLPVTQGKTMYGTDNRIELKDLDGDGIYTGSIALKAPSLYQVCYRVTYTSTPTNATVTNGGGILSGRRYYQYIRPTQVKAGGVITWPSSFTLPTMDWLATVLTIEAPPDLDAPSTGVAQNVTNTPSVYALEQNYPNPFNPSTVITYSVPEKAHVVLEIFNVLGQRVISLIDQEQSAGTHSIGWNARDSRNVQVSSGVYFLKMQTSSFSQVKKMLLMK
jgi:hypothetical protein